MKQCRQVTAILLLLFLLLTACAANSGQAPGSTPMAAPAKTPANTPTHAPTSEPEDTPTSTPESTPTSPPALPLLIETESFHGAIFTPEQAGPGAYRPQNGEPWTPSEAEILTLEEQLPQYLQEYYPELSQKLESYTRQYWGSATAEGGRAIYASFLCDADQLAAHIDWRTAPIEVMDGGDCYFQALYDVEQGAFVWLMVNGES